MSNLYIDTTSYELSCWICFIDVCDTSVVDHGNQPLLSFNIWNRLLIDQSLTLSNYFFKGMRPYYVLYVKEVYSFVFKMYSENLYHCL